jgi:hypothetical protein
LANALELESQSNNIGAIAAACAGLNDTAADVSTLCQLGALLFRHRREQEALVAYGRARASDSVNIVAAVGEVLVLERLGDVAAAAQRFDPLRSMASTNPDVAFAFSRLAPSLGMEAEACAALETLLAQGKLAASRRADLHFEIARLGDMTGQYDMAFRHADEACRAKRAQFATTGSQFDWIEAIISVFSAQFMAHAQRVPESSEMPVFIVGMPRSGTSLVEQMLVSHPAVAGGGELEYLPALASRMRRLIGVETPFPFCLPRASIATLNTLTQSYLAAIAPLAAGCVRVTDKLPGNFAMLGLIGMLFPRAKVIHMMRDARDTCLSCYFQNFASGHHYSYDLIELGHYYRAYERVMAHWRALQPVALYELRYEDLVADPERFARELVAFVGLEWDPGCLDFYRNRRSVPTPSYDQVRRPIYSSSIGRWRHYESQLQPLIAALAGAQAPQR